VASDFQLPTGPGSIGRPAWIMKVNTLNNQLLALLRPQHSIYHLNERLRPHSCGVQIDKQPQK
jgi:hypothetical protein